MVNGVDVSDKSRSFPQKEWTKLPLEVRKQIIATRKELRKVKKKQNVVASHSNPQDSGEEGQATNEATGSGTNFGSSTYKKQKLNQE